MRGTVSGEDAFRLYDTFGFPIDLTELMARERGYTVDIAGFEAALVAAARAVAGRAKVEEESVAADDLADATGWSVRRVASRNSAVVSGDLTGKVEWPDTKFVGYEMVEIETPGDGRPAARRGPCRGPAARDAVLRRVGRTGLRRRRDRRRRVARRRGRRPQGRRAHRGVRQA